MLLFGLLIVRRGMQAPSAWVFDARLVRMRCFSASGIVHGRVLRNRLSQKLKKG